jgi:hypothetical protein
MSPVKIASEATCSSSLMAQSPAHEGRATPNEILGFSSQVLICILTAARREPGNPRSPAEACQG